MQGWGKEIGRAARYPAALSLSRQLTSLREYHRVSACPLPLCQASTRRVHPLTPSTDSTWPCLQPTHRLSVPPLPLPVATLLAIKKPHQ